MKHFISLFVGILLASPFCCHGQNASFGAGWSSSFTTHVYSPPKGHAAFSQAALFPQTYGDVCGPFTVTAQTGQPIIAEAVTPEITSLAANLQNDPKLIFDYVHNNIRYVHYFGSKKGALLTLLEGSGNDFDQCALFAALMRSAATNSGVGYTVHYQFGLMMMPYSATNNLDLQHWFGFSVPPVSMGTAGGTIITLLDAFNWMRNYPIYESGGLNSLIVNNDGTYNNFLFHRVWVRLNFGGTNYFLDPAFKTSMATSGINVTNAMGFNAADIFSQAGSGATITSDYVQHLNWTNLNNKLTTYTTNLLSYMAANPNLSVEQVIGGYDVQPTTSEILPCLPFQPVTNFTAQDGFNGSIPLLEWDNIPTNYMSLINLHIDNLNLTYPIPALQARKISLTFTNISGNYQAQISLDDVVQATGTAGSGSGTVSMTNTISHPSGSWDFTNNLIVSDARNNQNDFSGSGGTPPYQRQAHGYAIVYGFDDVYQLLNRREQKLDALVKQNISSSDPRIVTETLNVMGLSWLNQINLQDSILGAQKHVMTFHHHRAGRVAAESGYYIDMRILLSNFIWRDGLSTFFSTFNPSDPSLNLFYYDQFTTSASEHAVIEQLQGNASVSTAKCIYLANQIGQKIILGTHSDSSNNLGTVSSLLSAETINNYGSDTNFILGILAESPIAMLLPSGHTTNGSWTGYGIGVFSGFTGAMIIGGGYHGGFPAQQVDVSPPYANNSTIGSSPIQFTSAPVTAPLSFGADPLNTLDGSFMVDSADLSVGQAEPRGFTFARHYDSNRRNANSATMANGWTHNYNINAITRSDPDAGLGRNTSQELAAFLAAQRAGFEMFTATPTGSNPQSESWAISALCVEWGVDSLISNAVDVTMGTANFQFIKQPDGSFTPPAGITMTLTSSNSAYNLQMRHGNLFQFATNGPLTNIVDQYNQTLQLAYDASNRLSTVTDWKMRALAFTYTNTPQRLTLITNIGTGRAVSFGYTTNANGQIDLTSVVDPLGYSNTFIYDTNHQVIVTKNALGQIVSSNVYDGFGHVIKQYSQGDTNQLWQGFWSGYQNTIVDPAGGQKQYFYDAKSRLIAMQDALGNLTQTVYDGQDHVVMSISPLNETNQFFYDGNNNLIQSIDSLGYSNTFVYDTNFNLIQTIDARTNSSHFGYNSKFQLTASTNAAGDCITNAYDSTTGLLTGRSGSGGTTTFAYDPTYGQLISITYPNNLGTNLFVNTPFGDVATNTNPGGLVTTFQYDLRRQLTNSVSGPSNFTTSIAYDAVGNVLSTKDPRGFSTSNTWSATRHLLSTTMPTTSQGIPIVSNVYDARDWLSAMYDPLQQATRYTNDLAQRLLSVTDPLLRTTSFTYDNDGRRNFTVDAATNTYYQHWAPTSRPDWSADQAGNYASDYYDGNGNVTFFYNRNTEGWTSYFDAANRLTNMFSPLGYSTKWAYNNRGLLQTITDQKGQNTFLSYDARGRLTNRSDVLATTTYQYDFDNNRTAVIEGASTNAWTYDLYDRPTSYTDPAGNLIQYRYDNNGNLTNLIYPGNRTVAYYYDSLNRLTNITDWANRKTTYTYDLDSRLKTLTRPNGTIRSLSYDVAGQATNIAEYGPSPLTAIAFFNLRWDRAGRVGLEFAAPLPHAYTPPGRTNTYDADDRLATFNGSAIVSDGNGNLTTGPLTNSTLTTYGYDARNRLTNVVGVLLGPPTLAYTYDAANNRAAIINTNAGTTTVFVTDPKTSQVLMRIKNGVTNYYVYGLGLVYEEDDTATATNTLTYHFDYRGSTVALTDGSGNVTDRIQYSAYGMVTFRGGTNDTPFQYNGKYGVQTDANGLLYMRARYYNPYICRFLNADPSGFAGGLNMYAYANGDPISLTDPFGLGAKDTSQTFSWFGNISNVGTQGSPNLVGSGLVSSIGASVLNGITSLDNAALNVLSSPDLMALGPMGAEFQEMGLASKELGVAGEAAQGIATPYGRALQSSGPEALSALEQVQSGAAVYKGGVLGKSVIGDSQFLALENPLNPGYAGRYGIPPQNANFNFILTGQVQPGASVITRAAPGIAPNLGGGIEAVTTPGSFQINSFHMP